MKAIVRPKGGKEFSTLRVEELPVSEPKSDEVLIRAASSRINPVDMDLMKGMPFLKYKKPQLAGVDGAGVVVKTGKDVNGLSGGDEVYYYRQFTDIGTWAEQITIPAAHVARIPKGLSPDQAGSIALPLLTAYESITSLSPDSGESILIHGAGGGVGYMAVQVAHALGLKVIANAGSRDREALEQLGVSRILNYKTEAFDQVLTPGTVDYVFDVIGKDTLLRSLSLRPQKVVSVAYADTAKLHKTGMQVPSILKFVLKLANGKFAKAAKKHGVQLIGQVTGANGALLHQASELFEEKQLHVKEPATIDLAEVESRGLIAKDVGKVIRFGA